MVFLVLCTFGFAQGGAFAVAAFSAVTYFEIATQWTGQTLSLIKIAGAALIIVTVVALVTRPADRTATLSVRAPAWVYRPWLVLWLVLFVAVATASAAWSVNLGQWGSHIQRLATDAIVFLAVPVLITRPEQIRRIGWTLLAAATTSVVYGAIAGTNLAERSIGTFLDPNEFAAALIPAMALGLMVSESSVESWQRWVGRCCGLVCMWGLLGTESRGGVVSLLVALVVVAATARGKERIRIMMLGVAGTAALVLVLTLTPAGTSLMGRITGEDSSGRADLWKVAVYEFRDNPIAGVGLGQYPERSREYLRADVRNIQLFISNQRTTHSSALEILAELGMIGFFSATLFIVCVMWGLVRSLRQARGLSPGRARELVPVGRGILVALAAMLASCTFLSGQYQELLWVLMGLAVAHGAMVHAALPHTPRQR